jgi:peroxiredoxin Q/BCP
MPRPWLAPSAGPVLAVAGAARLALAGPVHSNIADQTGGRVKLGKTPAVGDSAPDFELEGTDGAFKLSDHRGRRVVLLFYPGDNTPVCTSQFCSYRDRHEDFAALDAIVVGISSQNVDSHMTFTEKHKLTVPLLSDPGGQVAQAYSAFASRLGVTRRAVIVIDEQGIVRHRHDHLLGLAYRSVEDLRETLASLPAVAG